MKVVCKIEGMLVKDVEDNQFIGGYGVVYILQQIEVEKLKVFIYCNIGSLVIVGYGIVLGVIRILYGKGNIDYVFCIEIRLYN